MVTTGCGIWKYELFFRYYWNLSMDQPARPRRSRGKLLLCSEARAPALNLNVESR